MNETTATIPETTTTETEATTPPVTPALFKETDTPATEPITETQPDTTPSSETTALTAQDITIPEGTNYDEELGNSFLGLLNDRKLTRKELGQKLFDLYHAQGQKVLEGLKAAEAEKARKFEADLAAEKAEWLKQCESDKEFGGQKWESSQSVIDRGCRELATAEAVNLMQRYNLNTHPEIVRMFYRAGLLAGEDKSQVSGNGAGKNTDPAMAIFGESLREYHKRKGEMQ